MRWKYLIANWRCRRWLSGDASIGYRMLAVVGQHGGPVGPIANLPLLVGDRQQVWGIASLEGDRFDDCGVRKLLECGLPNLGVKHLIRQDRDLITLVINAAVKFAALGRHLDGDGGGGGDRRLGDGLQAGNPKEREVQVLG